MGSSCGAYLEQSACRRDVMQLKGFVAGFDRAANWSSVVIVGLGGRIFDPVRYRPDLSKETQ
jgi:hypothetical protein